MFKTKVVLESIREAITLQELASKYSLHPTQSLPGSGIFWKKPLDLQGSCYYFKPKGESIFNQSIMNVIDRKFLDCPSYGIKRMTAYLNKDLGYHEMPSVSGVYTW